MGASRSVEVALLLSLAGCSGKDEPVTECAKVLCASDEYCLAVYGGVPDTGVMDDLPLCTEAPADCDGHPSCDCLPDCTSCTEDDGVYCTVALP